MIYGNISHKARTEHMVALVNEFREQNYVGSPIDDLDPSTEEGMTIIRNKVGCPNCYMALLMNTLTWYCDLSVDYQ